jgi:hypothetical protein
VATPAELLADAKAAYHALVTGKQASVVVDQNGERVEFTRASATTLAAYIAQLETGSGRVSRGPLNPFF